MRNSILISLLLVVLLLSCTKHKSLKINGVISQANGEQLYLQEFNVSSIENIDSTTLNKNGKFKFEKEITKSGFYGLKLKNQTITIVAHPGDQISVKSDSLLSIGEVNFEGSEESQKILNNQRQLQDTKKKLDDLAKQYEQAAKNNAGDVTLISISEAYDSVINAQRKLNIVYIVENLNKLSSLLVLYQQLDDETYILNRVKDVQFYKILSDSLGKYFPDSKQVTALKNNARDFITKYNYQRLANKIENVDESSLPKLRIPNFSGDSIALTDLKGKVVILNFWASWNAQSIMQTQRLKGIYNKYNKKGLEIYSVSMDNDKEKWQAAVNFDEFKWINVSELSYPNSYAAIAYNVQSLPTYYLINKEQNDILGKNMNVEELDRRLSKLLN